MNLNSQGKREGDKSIVIIEILQRHLSPTANNNVCEPSCPFNTCVGVQVNKTWKKKPRLLWLWERFPFSFLFFCISHAFFFFSSPVYLTNCVNSEDVTDAEIEFTIISSMLMKNLFKPLKLGFKFQTLIMNIWIRPLRLLKY